MDQNKDLESDRPSSPGSGSALELLDPENSGIELI